MKRFVDDFKRKDLPLHCLMNNAGTENPPDRRTPEGLDVSTARSSWALCDAQSLPSAGRRVSALDRDKPAACTQVTLATNYFGTYYLTHMLLDSLRASAPSRMVITNSLSEMHGHLDFSDLKCALLLAAGGSLCAHALQLLMCSIIASACMQHHAGRLRLPPVPSMPSPCGGRWVMRSLHPAC